MQHFKPAYKTRFALFYIHLEFVYITDDIQIRVTLRALIDTEIFHEIINRLCVILNADQ